MHTYQCYFAYPRIFVIPFILLTLCIFSKGLLKNDTGIEPIMQTNIAGGETGVHVLNNKSFVINIIQLFSVQLRSIA